MKIIILGPPGSGKGTISERLTNEFGYTHISTGELLREEAAKNTPEAKQIQAILQSGALVPTPIIAQMLRKRVQNLDNYILDGFPRSLEQAELIHDLKIDVVISLDVVEEEVIKRFAGRRTCPKCNAGYNIDLLPPQKAGICDKCGTALIQRQDDNPETIKVRFKTYHQQTQPLLDYYTKKRMLHHIDASKDPQTVGKSVLALVKRLSTKTV